MNRKVAAGLMAGLLFGTAWSAWSAEPDGAVSPPPGVLPTLPENPGATAGQAHIAVPDQPGAPAPMPTAPLVTPSSTIFVASPNSTPCTSGCDVFFPNLIGGLQFGSSLSLFPGALLRVPLYSRTSYSIGDDENPRPQDRIYFEFNYFNDATTPTTRIDLSRETFGIEKTFLDGNASIGVRVPFFDTSSDFSLDDSDDVGDLTFIFKYAFINNRANGTVLSGGLAVTAPTGPAIPTLTGKVRDTLIQPFIGGSLPLGDKFYVENMSSIVVPTDQRDTTFFETTIALGYFLYRCDPASHCVRSIVPTFEVQVATPLDNRDPTMSLYYPDLVSMTAGVHLGLFRQSTLTVGAMTPITGPKPYDVGAVAQFDMRF